MDKIEKLQDDSLFMSELEALEWQEWEDSSIQTEMRKKGFADGLFQGINQGIEQGISQGLEQGIELTIKNMNKNNIPIETISKITNKSIQEINKIIKEK